MILKDSNIWIYYLDGELPEHPRSKADVNRALQEGSMLMPTIVQGEVLHHIARRMGEEAGPTAEAFMAAPYDVVPLSAGTMERAHRILLSRWQGGIGGRDAALLVHAKDHDATLVTHDQPLFEVARDWGLDAHDPIA